MKKITRFAGFAVALLLAGAAFAAGSPAVGKDPVPVEKTFGAASADAANVDMLTLTNTNNDFAPALAACASVSPASVAVPAVQVATLGDQLLVTDLAGARHYAREPERMTLAAVWRNFANIKQPTALALFAIPEPGGRSSDILAQLTSCNPDFRRT
jgi:hypothetical protein